MFVSPMFLEVSVRRHVMSNIFMYWSNVFADVVARPVSSR
jgi:hypothetical protein